MQVVVVNTPSGRVDCDQAGAVLVDYYAERPNPDPGSEPVEVAGFACNQVPGPDIPQVICADGASLLYSMWPPGRLSTAPHRYRQRSAQSTRRTIGSRERVATIATPTASSGTTTTVMPRFDHGTANSACPASGPAANPSTPPSTQPEQRPHPAEHQRLRTRERAPAAGLRADRRERRQVGPALRGRQRHRDARRPAA